MKTIFTALMGSHAHGLADEKSDKDFRSIYVHSTEYVLSIGPNKDPGLSRDDSITNDGDNVSFEIAHFLRYASKGNPTMLEMLKAPLVEPSSKLYAGELQSMLRDFLGKNKIFVAYKGYSYGQYKDADGFKGTDRRKSKAQTAAIRVLYNGAELLRTGDFTLKIVDTPIADKCRLARAGKLSDHEFSMIYRELHADLDRANDASSLPLEPNYEKINRFLLNVRRENWKPT